MADPTYYAAKIEECRRLLESSNDPLYRDVYQAMADEFAEKYAALSSSVARAAAAGTAPTQAPSVPPSPLLHQVAPPQASFAAPETADTAQAPRGPGRRRRGPPVMRSL